MYWDIATTAAATTTAGTTVHRSIGRHAEAQLAEAAKLWVMMALVVVAVAVSTLHEVAVAFAG